MAPRLRSLGQTIGVVLVGVTVVIAAGLVLVAEQAQRRLGEVLVEREIAAIDGAVGAIVQAEAEQAASVASAVAAMPAVTEAFLAQDRQRLLALTAPIFEGLKARGVAVDQFQFHLPPAISFLRVHQPGRFGDDLSSFRATVVAANRDRRPVVGLEGGVAGIGIRGVVPIASAGQHRGTVEIGLSIGRSLVEEIGARLGAEVALTAATRDGPRLMATTRPEFGGIAPAAFDAALATGIATGALDTTGARPVIRGTVPLRDFSGRPVALVVLERDATAIVAAQHRARLLLFGLSAALLLLAVAVAFWIGRSLSRPVRALAAETERITGGELETTVSGVARRDEIGVLARALDGFREALQEKRLQEERAAEAKAERERAQREMVAAMRNFGGSIGGVLNELGEASRRMLGVAEQMRGIAAAVQTRATQSRSRAEEAAVDLNGVAAATEELASSAKEVRRQAETTAQTTRDAVARAGEVDRLVDSLARTAGEIGGVVRVIDEIAAKTNLLALNATIEAARAGDAGKGFAVVAQEVKTLAAQTARGTAEIAERIEAVKAATAEAVAGVRGILAIVQQIDEVARGIATAVDQQALATGEITEIVGRLAGRTAEVAQGNAALAGEADRATGAADDVHETASMLSNQTAAIEREVRTFIEALDLDSDLRRFERYVCDLALRVIAPEGTVEARAIDVGRFGVGGIARSVPAWFKPGHPVEVMIDGVPRAVRGRLAHVSADRFGVMLLETEQTATALAGLLDRLQRSERRAA
ncbi:methyl-accepting chemotaxis protein [Elioraea thermophila]|uniref:methyl-accepting chemotaxis protein n=1 Tax=Elioraea thermophila TaxID=2185104 RepID=UPI000DF494CA|nr:cache domain-containing protein [Elioraea thermophila]